MGEKITSFNPVIDQNSAVMILGSMPSRESLRKQEYYGNNRNHFWSILFSIFDTEPIESYDSRIAFIKEHHIALWDVLKFCERKGSLDVQIKNGYPNPIDELLREYPNIKALFFNGQKSFQVYTKYFSHLTIPTHRLPSTSPIPGKYNKNRLEKIEQWKILQNYL
ncbi:DNA-deoxyinosine glycosylase [Halobacillus salinarum]|uniref:DNA-deoxyinosine glycosylase n=1 Tax=Halobacillus salinarum TaxID=2932257 RepID=A0ABY4EP40_9BACI|nr:DNA-deoxyinosine glycosylase [Halobacillus salinarum]UOQ46225.1 DNA-deoxyinosine glycosylase [Halobacillus salinarum]